MSELSWNDITQLHKQGRLPRPDSSGDAPLVGNQLVEVALCTSDQHGRFVDWSAWRAVMQLMDAGREGRLPFRFNRFIFNGDFTDWYELSRFPIDPAVVEPLDADVGAFHIMAGDVRSRLEDGEPIDVNPGNHEYRYELYLRTDARKLAGLKLLELPKVLKIEEFGATMHPKKGFMFGNCRVYHGETVRSHPAESAKHEMQKWGTGGTSGHVHRLAIYPRTTEAGDQVWTESGCLCKLDAEYMTHKPNWQHGCVILFRFADGTVHHELVRIIDGRVQGTLGLLVHGPATPPAQEAA